MDSDDIIDLASLDDRDRLEVLVDRVNHLLHLERFGIDPGDPLVIACAELGAELRLRFDMDDVATPSPVEH